MITLKDFKVAQIHIKIMSCVVLLVLPNVIFVRYTFTLAFNKTLSSL